MGGGQESLSKTFWLLFNQPPYIAPNLSVFFTSPIGKTILVQNQIQPVAEHSTFTVAAGAEHVM